MKRWIVWTARIAGILAVCGCCIQNALRAPFSLPLEAQEESRLVASYTALPEGYGEIRVQCGRARYACVGALVNLQDDDTVELYLPHWTALPYDLQRKRYFPSLSLLRFQPWSVPAGADHRDAIENVAIRSVYVQPAPLCKLGGDAYPARLIWQRPETDEWPQWKGVTP